METRWFNQQRTDLTRFSGYVYQSGKVEHPVQPSIENWWRWDHRKQETDLLRDEKACNDLIKKFQQVQERIITVAEKNVTDALHEVRDVLAETSARLRSAREDTGPGLYESGSDCSSADSDDEILEGVSEDDGPGSRGSVASGTSSVSSFSDVWFADMGEAIGSDVIRREIERLIEVAQELKAGLEQGRAEAVAKIRERKAASALKDWEKKLKDEIYSTMRDMPWTVEVWIQSLKAHSCLWGYFTAFSNESCVGGVIREVSFLLVVSFLSTRSERRWRTGRKQLGLLFEGRMI